jgi:hypothetical protein
VTHEVNTPVHVAAVRPATRSSHSLPGERHPAPAQAVQNVARQRGEMAMLGRLARSTARSVLHNCRHRRPAPAVLAAVAAAGSGVAAVAWLWPPQLLASCGSATSVVMAGDIGGTNSRLMLFEVADSDTVVARARAPGRLIFEKVYPNYKYSSMAEVVSQFQSDAARATTGSRPVVDVACLAVAGVVSHNTCRLTNLDWRVNGGEIASECGVGHVELINDFVAQGYGILTLGYAAVLWGGPC